MDVAPRGPLEPLPSPVFGRSWLYLFGAATVGALVVIVASGLVLALKGPLWWHFTGVGRFFNSIHLWAVELCFFLIVVHLWAKFWTAAWREGRAGVWVTGAIGFLAAVPAALTGYLSQQNLDAQWLATHAKDAFNSIGAGAFFNVTNFGQMYSYHVIVLPLALAVLALAHMRLVRRHGLAPPLAVDTRDGSSNAAGPGESVACPCRGAVP